MDELTLGLIGAGAVVVGGVVVYNAWQGAKVRRKMPRPMPDEAAESLARNEGDEEQPFIEPTRPVRRESAMGEGDGEAADTRVEPSFGGAPLSTVAPADTAVDIQAESTSVNGDFQELDSSSMSPVLAEDDEPVLPAATTISSAPPAIVDRRIDCVVPIRLLAPIPAEKLIPSAQKLRRAGAKPVHIEGKPEGGTTWELLKNGARYEELRAAAQLANRGGPLNELEFSEFVTGVQRFADGIDGSPEFPDMLETVGMAR